VVHAAQALFLVAAEEHRRAAVRAELRDHARPTRRRPVHDQSLAEQLHTLDASAGGHPVPPPVSDAAVRWWLAATSD